MIPLDMKSPSVTWFNAWRSQIASAKAYPEERDIYCNSAVISHAMHEIWLAQEIILEKSH